LNINTFITGTQRRLGKIYPRGSVLCSDWHEIYWYKDMWGLRI